MHRHFQVPDFEGTRQAGLSGHQCWVYLMAGMRVQEAVLGRVSQRTVVAWSYIAADAAGVDRYEGANPTEEVRAPSTVAASVAPVAFGASSAVVAAAGDAATAAVEAAAVAAGDTFLEDCKVV